MASIFTAPVYKLEQLNNIFIELTAKNCNQRCKNCYIEFAPTGFGQKKIKDFISIDRIKEMLVDTKSEGLHCIYLTGAEPMTHPDFNAILRLCLKRCNVCICTNGSFLNEKKIRFLHKVESEGENQILFKLSLSHFEETENDKVKYRGNFRQTIFALKTLSVYNFNSILHIQNHFNLKESIIYEALDKIFMNNNICNTNIQITKSHPSFEEGDYIKSSQKTDCMFGRVLSANGVYTCPFLAGDYRGRVGTTFKNYSKIFLGETDFCATCSGNNNYMFTIQ